MRINMIFETNSMYERVAPRTNEKDIPIFKCVFANEKGGVLEFQNTDRVGDNFWVIQQATNYRQTEVSVEDHVRNISLAKRDRLIDEMFSKQKEIDLINAKVLELNSQIHKINTI